MDIVFHREQLVVNTGRVKGMWRMMGPTDRDIHPKRRELGCVSLFGGVAPTPGMSTSGTIWTETKVSEASEARERSRYPRRDHGEAPGDMRSGLEVRG